MQILKNDGPCGCGVMEESRGTRRASSPKAEPNDNPITPSRRRVAKPTLFLLSSLPSFRPSLLLRRLWPLPYLAGSFTFSPPPFSTLPFSLPLTNPHTGTSGQLQGSIFRPRHSWRTTIDPKTWSHPLASPQLSLPSRPRVSWSLLRSVTWTFAPAVLFSLHPGSSWIPLRTIVSLADRQPWARVSLFSLPPGNP
ncbi:uncharacterized protein BJX67DRAFT_44177 [Aspergillus lucknowensis]|uniref:Uncharacterized protein n=1 Tax=Aspergillus lucknowensis TaxID=176173 RepID=A0ABR4LWI8_9EURO